MWNDHFSIGDESGIPTHSKIARFHTIFTREATPTKEKELREPLKIQSERNILCLFNNVQYNMLWSKSIFRGSLKSFRSIATVVSFQIHTSFQKKLPYRLSIWCKNFFRSLGVISKIHHMRQRAWFTLAWINFTINTSLIIREMLHMGLSYYFTRISADKTAIGTCKHFMIPFRKAACNVLNSRHTNYNHNPYKKPRWREHEYEHHKAPQTLVNTIRLAHDAKYQNPRSSEIFQTTRSLIIYLGVRAIQPPVAPISSAIG